MKKTILSTIVALLLVTSTYAADSAMEMWTLGSDSAIWSSNSMVNQDGSVMTSDTSVQTNDVVAWSTQVTDEQVVAWDQVINLWAETTLAPLSEEEVDLNSAWLAWENEANWVTMWNVEVNKLPTTWLEESLLIIVSLLISGALLFRNRFIKK